MKTFRKLMEKYVKEWAALLCFLLLCMLSGLIAIAVMALPGIAIAYFCGWAEWKIAGFVSFFVIEILILIGRGVWKVCKDYQEIKREDNEEE